MLSLLSFSQFIITSKLPKLHSLFFWPVQVHRYFLDDLFSNFQITQPHFTIFRSDILRAKTLRNGFLYAIFLFATHIRLGRHPLLEWCIREIRHIKYQRWRLPTAPLIFHLSFISVRDVLNECSGKDFPRPACSSNGQRRSHDGTTLS